MIYCQEFDFFSTLSGHNSTTSFPGVILPHAKNPSYKSAENSTTSFFIMYKWMLDTYVEYVCYANCIIRSNIHIPASRQSFCASWKITGIKGAGRSTEKKKMTRQIIYRILTKNHNVCHRTHSNYKIVSWKRLQMISGIHGQIDLIRSIRKLRTTLFPCLPNTCGNVVTRRSD